MSVTKASFGSIDGLGQVSAFRLENGAGMSAVLLDYGAAVQSLCVKNAAGTYTDAVLGYDTAEEYAKNDAYLGACIGRVGNRLGGAEFSLNGVRHRLYKNDGENHLHGGLRGFDKYIWQAETGESFVRFSRVSPDGEENYPGTLQASVTYTLGGDNALHIAYDALCDRDTLVNLTNHTYFNLNGGGSVLGQRLMINAERITELGEGTLPTGRLLDVQGTAFDFRTLKPIGQDIDRDEPQLLLGGGYDHNFVLCGAHAARAECAESGIRLDVYTDMPGLQLYSANFLGSRRGKNGAQYAPRHAFCLETQLFPNSMRCWGFPSPVLRAGVPLHSETVYAFSLI